MLKQPCQAHISAISLSAFFIGKIYDSRLSNGPIESINRKVKDLNRLGRGFRNFEHFRNRLPNMSGMANRFNSHIGFPVVRSLVMYIILTHNAVFLLIFCTLGNTLWHSII